MKQMTLTTIKGFEVHGRATHKAAFLMRMEMLGVIVESGVQAILI